MAGTIKHFSQETYSDWIVWLSLLMRSGGIKPTSHVTVNIVWNPQAQTADHWPTKRGHPGHRKWHRCESMVNYDLQCIIRRVTDLNKKWIFRKSSHLLYVVFFPSMTFRLKRQVCNCTFTGLNTRTGWGNAVEWTQESEQQLSCRANNLQCWHMVAHYVNVCNWNGLSQDKKRKRLINRLADWCNINKLQFWYCILQQF